MNWLLIDAFQSPDTWLWMAAVVGAILLLGSAANRRRGSLVQALRDYVDRTQPRRRDDPAEDAVSDAPTSNE